MSKFIYVMQSGRDDYKIGVSSDPMKRSRGVQTGSSTKVNLIFSVWTDTPFIYEKILHNKYQDHQIIGEWFRFEDQSFIKEIIDLVLSNKCGEGVQVRKVYVGDADEVSKYIQDKRVVSVRDIPRTKKESDVVISGLLKDLGCVKKKLPHGQFWITPQGFDVGLTEFSMPKILRAIYEEDKGMPNE